MDVNSEDVRDTIGSKNFNKFVVWCKGWPKALRTTADLIEHIERTGDFPDNLPGELKRLRIHTKLKGGEKSKKEEQIKIFFSKYSDWAKAAGYPVPRNLTRDRSRKIWNIISIFSNNEISDALRAVENASDWHQERICFDLDFFTRVEKVEALLSGKYAGKRDNNYLAKDGL